MKKVFLSLFIFTLLFLVGGEKSLKMAQAATPWFSCADAKYSASLICKGEHPRLYLTQATLPYFRDKIATDWKTEMQTFVNHVDGGWSGYPTSVSADGMIEAAFLYQILPVPGVTAKHTNDEYGQVAHEIFKKWVAGTVLGSKMGLSSPNYEAIAYDWIYPLLGDTEKQFFARDTIDAIVNGSTQRLYSQPFWNYAIGARTLFIRILAFYGDGVDDTGAQTHMQNVMKAYFGSYGTFLWADALAGDDGGWSEGFKYAGYSYATNLWSTGAWETATGEKVLTNSRAYQLWPQYIIYHSYPFSRSAPISSKLMGGCSRIIG